jgi:uncharacterized membrane protein
MGKFFAILNLLKKGEAVVNKTAWKTGQITVAILTPVIVALGSVLSYFGVSLPLDETTINTIASGIIALVHVVLTTITSEKVGLPDSD